MDDMERFQAIIDTGILDKDADERAVKLIKKYGLEPVEGALLGIYFGMAPADWREDILEAFGFETKIDLLFEAEILMQNLEAGK